MVFQGPGLVCFPLWLQGSPNLPLSPRKTPKGRRKMIESEKTSTRTSLMSA